MIRRFITLEQLKSVASALLAKINQKPDSNSLSDVSFTGDYNDLNNRPNFSNFVSKTAAADTYNELMSNLNSNYMIIGRDYVTAGQKSGTTLGTKATAEGTNTTASGDSSHAEGEETIAYGEDSHAEGVGGYAENGIMINLTGAANATQYNVVSINDSEGLIAEYGIIGAYLIENTGYDEFSFKAIITNVSYDNNDNISTITLSQSLASSEISNETYFIYIGNAIGYGSHSEGIATAAISSASHAEGAFTFANGQNSHTEGHGTTASGTNSHAEGSYTYATGENSHVEGGYTNAHGNNAHAEGLGTIAQRRSQHVFGEYNISDVTGSSTSDKGSYVEIVGNGDGLTRSNARTLDWSGNEVLAGKLTVGTGPTNNMDVATKQYVDTAIPTYTLSISGNRITLTSNSDTTSYINLPVYDGTVVNGGGQA